MGIPEISIAEAVVLLGDAVFVDIRDPNSFGAGHIPGAIAATQENIDALLENTPKSQEIVIYCYHGNSSRGATQWFQQRGFEAVRSMSGGFEDWRLASGRDEAYAISKE